jgi:PKD repeat protein
MFFQTFLSRRCLTDAEEKGHIKMQKQTHLKTAIITLALSVALLCASTMAMAQENPDLTDLIKGLKVISGTATALPSPLDINADQKFGQEEVAYIFQVIAGLREMGGFDNGITVSGTVKDVADSSVPTQKISVELSADINNNGIYEANEIFTAQTDDNGFFAFTVQAFYIPRATIHTRAPGYSEFIKKFENIGSSFSLTAEVSKGEYAEIDISGISAGPARAGRVVLDTDKTFTLKVFKNKITENQAARISPRFGGTDPKANGNELMSVTFPLRGMDVPAGSEKIYANAAYLDSVNNPEVMPGDFQAEGESDSPRDILKTYAASMIKVYDENGNELMNDVTNRSSEIKIKIAIPWEAYETLEDENGQTADIVEIGLYYYDEAAQIWKLHRNADNSPAYGHLEDNFGNVLAVEDLRKLQDVELDADGKFVKTAYAPAGADPSEITIYNVGTVHHFTIYNSDKAGSTCSLNIGLTDQDGNPTNAQVRYRKIRGSWWTDYDKRAGKKRRSVQAYRPEKYDNAVGKLLFNNKAERDQWLRYVLERNDPALLQAITDGIQRYAVKNREAGSNDPNEFSTGITSIFNNQEITDAIDDAASQIDCSQYPALCKNIVAQAAEQVAQAADPGKAAAFLMEILAGAYNPGQPDFEYALDIGIGMMDLAVNTGNAVRNLGTIPTQVNAAKQLRNDIKALYDDQSDPPAYGADNWNTYFDKTYQLQQAVANIKKQAQSLGSSLGRVAPRTAADQAPPRTEEGLAQIKQEMLWDYEDVGGVLYGANRFGRFKWGYYSGDNFTETSPPAGLIGGGEIGVFEYYNGSQWTILPGRSSTGVDAGFAPVPNVLSWGDGSSGQPAANLGDWVIDASPNVQVTGRVVDNSGNPFASGTKIPVYIAGNLLHPDSSGQISARISLFEETAAVIIPGMFNQSFPVVNNMINIGNMVVGNGVVFNKDYSSGVTLAKNAALQIDGSAFALSGAAVSYNFKLYSGYYWYEQTPMAELNNVTGIFSINEGFAAVGYYSLAVTATANAPDNPFAQTTIRIQVVNQPPVINSMGVAPDNADVGTPVTVSMDATDPDGKDDIRYRGLNAICNLNNGTYTWMGATQGQDGDGKPIWTINTDNYYLYQQVTGDISCTIDAYVYDSSWGYGSSKKSFTLKAKSVPPDAYAYINDKYVVSYPLPINPGWVWFIDKNSDIVRYELNCGLPGSSVITSDQPIHDVDPDTPGDQACMYDPGQVGGETGPFTFSYKAIDSQGNEKEIRSEVTLLQPIHFDIVFPDGLAVEDPNADGDIIVKLPAPDNQGNRSFSFNVNADSPNGNLALFKYSVTYQPAYAYWWSYLAWDANGPIGQDGKGSGSVPMTIDRPGKYYVFARVQDDAGMSAGYSKTFYVTADFDYRLKLNNKYVEQQKPWYLTTEQLNFGYDPVGTLPSGFTGGYQWDILYAGQTQYTSAGTGAQLQTTLPEGTHIVRLTMSNTQDANQPPVVKETGVTVYAPLSPTITSTYVYPVQQGVVALGDLYALTANITLPDGVALKDVSWRVTKSDFTSAEDMYSVAGANGLLERTFKFNTVGSYRVWVSVEDDRGLTGNATSSFQVQEYPPVIDSLTADKLTGAPPLTVNLTAAAHDPDGQVVNYIWKVTGQYTGASGQTVYVNETKIQNLQNSTDPNKFGYAFDNLGTYKMSLVVEDDSGRKSAVSEKTIQVAYQPPVINSLTADKTTGETPLEVNFTANATDPDGTIVNYEWDVNVDGSIEQSGETRNTFTYTFAAPGQYPVQLTVTDSQGKKASRRVTIYVFAPGSGVVFSFKEIRADGLGPDIDFAAMNDFQFQEIFGKFAQTGYDDVTFFRENGRDFTNPIVGRLGFDGFYSDSWCNPMQYLAKINTPGTYDIGINLFNPDDPGVTLNFPPQYTRAAVIFSGYAQAYGIYDTIDPAGTVVLHPSRDNMNQQGTINVLALLGTEVVNGTYCKTTNMRFVSGTGSSFSVVDDATQIQSKALQIPGGFTLSNLTMTLNNIPISTSEWGLGHLPKDAESNYLIPVIPGANYELLIKKDASKFYTLKYTAAEIAAAGDALIINPEVFQTTALNLANVPGAGNITLTYGGSKGTAASSFYLNGTETSLADIPVLADSTSLEILTPKYFKKTTVAQVSGAIDFSSLVSVSLTGLTVSVDETQKTVTVNYASPAPMALVNVLVSFDMGRTRQFSFITDPLKTSLTFSYSIPEFSIEQHWGTQTCPAADAIQSATATVTAMQPSAGYDDTLRNLFEHLGFPNWSLNNFINDKRIDEYITVQTTWNKQP